MSNYLIEQSGKVTECLPGATHNISCKHLFKQSLNQFIKAGGVRVVFLADECIVEVRHFLTFELKHAIRRLLRQNEVYHLYAHINGALEQKHSEIRPIRTLPF